MNTIDSASTQYLASSAKSSLGIQLFSGDNRESLRRLIDQGVRVHSVVTDPPYGLVSVQKRFGKDGAAAARTEGNDGSFARLSGGFMGKAWDATGIERDPEFWRLIWEILLPGGYVFAFSGSRTGHWQACAMETAGFIMHPMHGWVFGSGFPKAHAADKAIDKMLGIEREIVGQSDRGSGAQPNKLNNHGSGDTGIGYADGSGKVFNITRPGSPEAAQWEGWAYGTQTQKPALEPIYLGQKPFSEKTGAANLLKHGVGAVNIDGCRVALGAEEKPFAYPNGRGGEGWHGRESLGSNLDEPVFGNANGRHPANLILDGSPEVVAMFPNDNARFFHQFPRYSCETCLDVGWFVEGQTMDNPYGEQVHCHDCHGMSAEPMNADPLFYHPKAGKVDRAGSRHPTVKPIALMQYLIRHITPPGGTVLDPFAGSGTTAEAARREGFDCILMEAEPEYTAFLRRRFGLPDLPKDVDIFA